MSAPQTMQTVETATRLFAYWSADVPPFYVFVLRPAPNPAVAAVQESLRRAGVGALLPPAFLHITVQSLGNIGEGGLTEAIAAELADAVAVALAPMPPFAVTLRGVYAFSLATAIAVHEQEPGGPLQRMQRAVVDALRADGRVPVRHPERPYLPHLSICYYDRPYPARTVADALAPYEDQTYGDLWVDTVELVRIAGDGTFYPPMETVRALALGSAMTAPRRARVVSCGDDGSPPADGGAER